MHKQPEEDEDITSQIASPPKQQINQVQTLKELSSASKFALPTAKESGIDITLLTKVLIAQEDVVEPDEEWEFNHMFVKVTSELQLEQEAEEEMRRREEEDKDGPATGLGSTSSAAGANEDRTNARDNQ
jgi:hypothetical protein